MKVEIIAIGDELLIGQTVNTNASWIGKQMAELGASVEYCTVIRDERVAMLNAFRVAMDRVDIVLVTGGLGPTKDDITKDVLCDFFETKLVQNNSVLEHVTGFFKANNRVMLDVNKDQALVPEKSEVLHNALGTAPGMWFEKNQKVLVSMPGVPYEMKSLINDHVVPRLLKRFELTSLYYRTIQTQGIGESYLAERIKEVETSMRASGVSLAYLPSPGAVRLRLSGLATDEIKLSIGGYIEEVTNVLPQYVFGYGDTSIEIVIGKLLVDLKFTLSTVESCTGGAVAAAITTVSGSSAYYEGSIISYSNRIKKEKVGVKPATLIEFGAVSRQTVEEMAVGGRDQMDTDYCIALSGIAGPEGGSVDKPVGTVWIAIAGPERVISKRFQFEKDRQRNIRRSVLTSLNMLRCELLEINIEKS